MMDAPSSTWFTASPHWGWYIVFYFFIGGLAGGSYFLASIIDQFGRREDRPLARLGYYIAFPAVLVCGLLLTVDLHRPFRFWHMLVERNTFEPMFKHWSPMSIGSWALMVFGFFSFLSFLAALAEDERVRPALQRFRYPALVKLRPPFLLGRVIGVLGGIAGFYIAAYTGVLLAVTNRPIWSDTPLLGMLFLVSAASTSAALLVLLAHRFGWTMRGVRDLHHLDDWVLVLELAVLIALIISLGPVAVAWLNAWGLLLLVGVIIIGMIVPLVLSFRARRGGHINVPAAAAMILVGGFILRMVIVLSSEAI
jgi:formate-dependent nitrite reductase membrane component NrfD